MTHNTSLETAVTNELFQEKNNPPPVANINKPSPVEDINEGGGVQFFSKIRIIQRMEIFYNKQFNNKKLYLSYTHKFLITKYLLIA